VTLRSTSCPVPYYNPMLFSLITLSPRLQIERTHMFSASWESRSIVQDCGGLVLAAWPQWRLEPGAGALLPHQQGWGPLSPTKSPPSGDR